MKHFLNGSQQHSVYTWALPWRTGLHSLTTVRPVCEHKWKGLKCQHITLLYLLYRLNFILLPKLVHSIAGWKFCKERNISNSYFWLISQVQMVAMAKQYRRLPPHIFFYLTYLGGCAAFFMKVSRELISYPCVKHQVFFTNIVVE